MGIMPYYIPQHYKYGYQAIILNAIFKREKKESSWEFVTDCITQQL